MDLTRAPITSAPSKLRALDVATIRPLDAPGPDGESLLDVAIDPDEGSCAARAPGAPPAARAGAIASLPERERQILALSYEEELTLAEIGDVLGVSESRVCQLRSLAVARLRTALSGSLGIEVGR